MTEYFSNIKDILNGAEFRTVKTVYAKIIEDWNDIVGKKFASKSEIGEFFKKANRLYLLVHVKSSPLVQELGFFKKNIINKIKEKYSVEISDIIIKPYSGTEHSNTQQKESEVLEVYESRPTQEELDNIYLDPITIEQIKLSISKQAALDVKQKERMYNIITKDLKTQEWMRQKGFPICKKCGRVMTRKIFGEENICNICKNNTKQEE